MKTTFVSAYDSVVYDLMKPRLSDSLAEAEELRPCPHVSRYFWKRRFFSSFFFFFLLFNLPFTCKRRFGHRKLYFSRTVTRVKVFENAGFLYLCLSVMISYFHHFSVFMWTGESGLNTLRVEAYLFSERRNRKAWQRALWLVYPSASSSNSDNLVFTKS